MPNITYTHPARLEFERGRFVIFSTRLTIYTGALQKHTQNSLKHNLNNRWALYAGLGNWDRSQLGWNFNKCFAITFAVYFKQGTGSTVSEIKDFLLTEQIMCNARSFPSAQSPALESLPRKDGRIFFSNSSPSSFSWETLLFSSTHIDKEWFLNEQSSIDSMSFRHFSLLTKSYL